MEEFNFIQKNVIIELVNGTKVDGELVYADEQVMCLKEAAGLGVLRKIVYRDKIACISCFERP